MSAAAGTASTSGVEYTQRAIGQFTLALGISVVGVDV